MFKKIKNIESKNEEQLKAIEEKLETIKAKTEKNKRSHWFYQRTLKPRSRGSDWGN